MIFYEKQSRFKEIKAIKTSSNDNYTLNLAQSELFQGELVLANTDFSIKLCDIASSSIVGTFD